MPKKFRRSSYEFPKKFLGVSKATVNRKISDWISTGEAKKVGQGKSTRYTLSEDLMVKLNIKHKEIMQ